MADQFDTVQVSARRVRGKLFGTDVTNERWLTNENLADDFNSGIRLFQNMMDDIDPYAVLTRARTLVPTTGKILYDFEDDLTVTDVRHVVGVIKQTTATGFQVESYKRYGGNMHDFQSTVAKGNMWTDTLLWKQHGGSLEAIEFSEDIVPSGNPTKFIDTATENMRVDYSKFHDDISAVNITGGTPLDLSIPPQFYHIVESLVALLAMQRRSNQFREQSQAVFALLSMERIPERSIPIGETAAFKTQLAPLVQERSGVA